MTGEIRELLSRVVRSTSAALDTEPREHVKEVLAQQVAEDTAFLTELEGAQHADPPAGLEAVYAEIKPALIAALVRHEKTLDPLNEEPELESCVRIRHAQERHLVELPVEVARGRVALLHDR